MKDWLLVVITILGGLGTFLLGMKHLSEGLQAISGKGLRKFMALATTHRLAGVGTGILSTVIVQSSSIITVMAVGFVSSGVLNLQQAINVIIGSNIGTTTTAWIIAYAPEVKILGLSIISVGAILYFFINKELMHNIGLALMGLGFIFLGLHWIKEGVEPIKNNPAVIEIFKSLDAKTAWGLLRCTFVSMVFTAIVQSSAATTAIAMALAMQGLITFEAAAATVFGMNIGTTITAWMAAFNSTTEAKRTAMAHTLFNVVGAVLLVPLFLPVVVPLSKTLFPDYATNIPAPMAAVHTFFNIATTCVFLPFVSQFAKFVEKIIPAKKKEIPRLTFLDPHVKQSPVIALEQVAKEIGFMAKSNKEIFNIVRNVISGTSEKSEEDHIFHREDILDKIQKEITVFVGHVMTGRLPAAISDRARKLLRITDELESISDEAPTILKTVIRMRANDIVISEKSKSAILSVHDRIMALSDMVSRVVKAVSTNGPSNEETDFYIASREIKEFIRETRKEQLMRFGSDESAPMRVLVKLDILNAYERVRGYYENIVETVGGGKIR
jgi:phosphate:Na+ symporter